MTVPEMVRGVEPECITLVQSHNSVNWQAEANYAVQLLCANSFAVKIAQQNPVSVQNALRNAAAIGISLNPASKHAYLVPRNSQTGMAICLDISYMGLLHLAMSTGSIEFGQAKLVYETDHYENQGIDKAPVHKYNAFGNRGALVGAYCVVRTSTGAYLTEEMSVEQLHDVRNRSEAFKKDSGPWKTDYEEMCRKTVVKRASKYWPKVDRLNNAIDYLNTDGGEGINQESASVDVTPISEKSLAQLTEIYATSQNQQALWDWLCRGIGRQITELSELTESEAQKALSALKAAR